MDVDICGRQQGSTGDEVGGVGFPQQPVNTAAKVLQAVEDAVAVHNAPAPAPPVGSEPTQPHCTLSIGADTAADTGL